MIEHRLFCAGQNDTWKVTECSVFSIECFILNSLLETAVICGQYVRVLSHGMSRYIDPFPLFIFHRQINHSHTLAQKHTVSIHLFYYYQDALGLV